MATKHLTSEQLYDSIGPSYENAFLTLTPQKDSIDWLISQLSSKKPAQVLDIGSSTGQPVCLSLTNADHVVSGIDVSSAMVDAAKHNVPQATFTKIDLNDFTAPQSSYDAITVYFSLIEDKSQDQIRSCIRRIFDWLRPGGVFVWATLPLGGNDLETTWMGRQIRWSGLSTEELHAHLKEVGFDIVYSQESKFQPKGAEAGICGPEDEFEELQIFLYCRKPE